MARLCCTVLQGMTQDTVHAEIGYGEEVSRRLWSKKLEEGIGLTARHKDTEHPEGRRVFELESAVSGLEAIGVEKYF